MHTASFSTVPRWIQDSQFAAYRLQVVIRNSTHATISSKDTSRSLYSEQIWEQLGFLLSYLV